VPELPDVALYIDALQARLVGQRLDRIIVSSPFVVRTVTPPVTALEGRLVTGFRRLGKQIVFEFEGGLFMVVHLMIAGRFQWKPPGPPPRTRIVLAAFIFPAGVLLLTEAGSKRRAALHVVEGESNLSAFYRGGLEVMDASLDDFNAALVRENHTLKRALTDPRIFSGIGNAYSDEILHAAQLSPLTLTSRLTPEQIERLWRAVTATLEQWTMKLKEEAGGKFPAKVTAFRPDMAVHGRFGRPCPRCGGPVQRIVYAANECNYCPACQTGGKLLADRAMSRLLKKDWPRSLDEWDEHLEARRVPRPPSC
jgi:formamidopyrimidine-DNA glycosylase